MFGVSPAYFLSRFGTGFSARDVARGLEDIAAMGFDAVQPEVYHPAGLEEWETGGAAGVGSSRTSTGLSASQFVGHFLLHSFESQETLTSDIGIGEFRRLLGLLTHFPECRTVTVPIPGLEREQARGNIREDRYAQLYDATIRKIEMMVELAAAERVILSLEIMPYSVVAGTDGFLRLMERLDNEWLGFTFDTGHAWAMKERLELIPGKLAGRIAGTHLCDNDGGASVSLAPGDGTIDWPGLLRALRSAGYTGSLDIEIRCEQGAVSESYRHALDYLASICEDEQLTSLQDH